MSEALAKQLERQENANQREKDSGESNATTRKQETPKATELPLGKATTEAATAPEETLATPEEKLPSKVTELDEKLRVDDANPSLILEHYFFETSDARSLDKQDMDDKSLAQDLAEESMLLGTGDKQALEVEMAKQEQAEQDKKAEEQADQEAERLVTEKAATDARTAAEAEQGKKIAKAPAGAE